MIATEIGETEQQMPRQLWLPYLQCRTMRDYCDPKDRDQLFTECTSHTAILDQPQTATDMP